MGCNGRRGGDGVGWGGRKKKNVACEKKSELLGS